MANFIDTAITAVIILGIGFASGKYIASHFNIGVPLVGLIIAALWLWYLWYTGKSQSPFEKFARRLVEIFATAAIATFLSLNNVNPLVIAIVALFVYFGINEFI
jgi:hypothetical protein